MAFGATWYRGHSSENMDLCTFFWRFPLLLELGLQHFESYSAPADIPMRKEARLPDVCCRRWAYFGAARFIEIDGRDFGGAGGSARRRADFAWWAWRSLNRLVSLVERRVSRRESPVRFNRVMLSPAAACVGLGSWRVTKPALRTIGNIVCAEDDTDYTQHIIDAGAVPCLQRLIAHSNREIQKEVRRRLIAPVVARRRGRDLLCVWLPVVTVGRKGWPRLTLYPSLRLEQWLGVSTRSGRLCAPQNRNHEPSAPSYASRYSGQFGTRYEA